jgi:hypothetical protein
MIHRTVAAVVVALACTGVLPAEETRGRIVKIEDGSITIRTLVVVPDHSKGAIATPEDKTFKIGKNLKIARVIGKGKQEAEMALDDLKAAVKAGRVSVRIVHEGENCSIIRVLPPGLGG